MADWMPLPGARTGCFFTAENPGLQQELADTVCRAGGKDVELLDSMVGELLRYFTLNRLSIPCVTYQPVRIGEATIPAGTTVIMNAWALNRDPDVWDHPDTFDPYRFVGVTGREALAHFAFGAGRHSCPGQYMAQRQLCALLGAILRHFRMEKADDTKALDPLLDVEDPWALASKAPRTRVR
ncbi:3-hydroxyphenylacetate 6-hydroxylase [Malassezia nana]|uniref:3-hydroxyphenylacetate 6-hydroxylase n=1 Tax=Malassezia nana TaxID=180528 RepID=A0AAF0ELS8_9BASI|nr:3-hydroxyphenylacetate 6-hydroxylase [Malassezia nana]